VGPGNARQQF